MIKFLIHRPVAVIMVFIAAVVLGIIAYFNVPVSLMPNIPIPEVTVNVSYKNSSARELENAVVKPLRMQLMQVVHLSDIKSETRDGAAIIRMKFDFGTKIDYAFIEVNEKIDGIMGMLPRDMERPKVIKASATDIPMFYLNVSLDDSDSLHNDNSDEVTTKFIELCEFSENVIRKRIEQLPEVALVDLSGTVNPQLVIEPNLDKLQSINLSLNQLEELLTQNNVTLGSLLVNDGHYQYNIRFTSVLRTKEDVENIFFKTSGKIFQVKDIAKVSIQSQKRSGMFAANGKPAITMAIIKQADAKLSSMKDKISDLVDTFEHDYPGVHFEASQDQSQFLDISISNLKQNLGQGLLLVILVVFLFLKDFKSPLLIGLTLVVSIIICMLIFRIMSLSINIISLAGLILAIGNMMDNSIVVTDNISQYRERGKSIDDACVTGTNELITPMLSSMLTNISVFLPMIFLSGLAGALIYDQAISVTIGLGVSYIVGITLMPVLYRIFYKNSRNTRNLLQRWKDNIFLVLGFQFKKVFSLDKVYESILHFTFNYKKLNVFLYTAIIPIGILVVVLMRKEKMPPIPQTEVIINIDWNENINVGENKKRVCDVLKALQSKTEQSNCFIGHQQFLMNRDYEMASSEAKIYIKTGSPDNIMGIENTAKDFINKQFPRCKLSFDPPTTIFEKLFTSNEPPLVAEVSFINRGNDISIPKLLEFNQNLNGNKRLNTINKIPLQEHVVLVVNMEKLLLYDVSFDALYKLIKTAFKENYVGTLRSNQRYIPIVISGEEKYLTDIVGNTVIVNNNKQQIPLNALLCLSKGQDIKTIFAGKDGEYIPFDFFPTSNQKDIYISDINKTVSQSKVFNVSYSGSLFSSMKMLNELGIILLISVLLLYFILAAQFESLVQPLLVLLELPIDFAGAIIVLYLFGHSLNIMSVIGIVIMSGIIINDSILKIDVINQLRKGGCSLMEAIWEGGHRRLRAILMTSLTSVLAMIPLLFSNDLGSELQKPFSYALIGGMIIGTVVSLFFVPLVYWYIYRKYDKNVGNIGAHKSELE
ncbi:MAG: efflux RND transporter permease subunit [Bacteroidales bacterium]|nr:MAG: efflux RND transporter permease subunit [Bacteroidales bacterium]